ncbi:MAG: Bax inhibitor-1/YccA family protein [Bacteroidetes bacterium]|nr:Bax inhibitor-1/YccA family protein [Bacteroidota bacterium]
MKSSNPILRSNAFSAQSIGSTHSEKMTVKGTALKGLLLLMLALVSALWTWQKFFISKNPQDIISFMFLGSIGGFIFAIITTFKKEWSPITAPIYAILEGFAIGGISAFFEAQYPGIAIQASSLTFGTFTIMFGLYSSGIIPVTEKLKIGITAAIGGIALIYFVSFIMGLFGSPIGFINNSGPIGIGFSLLVVGVAAFSLLLDFDLIKQAEKQGAPKYMEWYGAFGVMVTLVWLYLEILRLLSKLRDRKN